MLLTEIKTLLGMVSSQSEHGFIGGVLCDGTSLSTTATKLHGLVVSASKVEWVAPIQMKN